MSKIKIFSMGGLNENGKNTYIVEVDNKIFILDAGLKYATESMYGIDYILPNYDYLEKNRKRIVGVFLTHAHPENMGGVMDLVRTIPEIKIFCTKYTKKYLELEGLDSKKITEIMPHRKLNFRDVSIFPITVTHSAPDAVMYVINTKDGAVVYTGDFIIDPSMSDYYHMDLGKVAYVGKQGVLALLSESVFTEVQGHTSPKHKLSSFFKDLINKTNDRMIFTVLPFHLYTIDEIFEAAKNSHRKVVVMGKKLQNVINMAIENNYLKVNPNIIGDLSHIDNSNTILLVCDDKEHPYSAIDKIVSGYDKFIKLKKEDTVVFAEPKYDENEKILVRIENEIAKMGSNIVTLPKDKEILQHASSQDLMLMIDLLQPKYYMPVKGDYRYMVNNADLATSLGIKPENIILKQNGEVITIKDGKLLENHETIAVNETLIDGNSNDDVGELVIKDREMLGENGIVLISVTLSKQTKKVLVGPEIITRGFIYVKDSKEMIEEIKKISLSIVERNVNDNYVDYNNIKLEIREHLSKYFYHETECKPMIIAVIQEV